MKGVKNECIIYKIDGIIHIFNRLLNIQLVSYNILDFI